MIVYLSAFAAKFMHQVGVHPHAGVLFSYVDGQTNKGLQEMMSQVENARELGWKTFLDSGAFSAWTQGETIDVHEYSAFLDKWGDLFDVKATLDVIGDAAATEKNTEILGWGRVLPVFHYGDPPEYLDRMLEKTDHIAFGGMVGLPRKAFLRWVSWAFGAIGTRPARVHGFGVTGPLAMSEFPWDSTDSTTPLAVCKRNMVVLPAGTHGFPSYFSAKAISKGSIGSQLRVSRHFKGAFKGQLFTGDPARKATMVASAVSILDFAARISRVREERQMRS